MQVNPKYTGYQTTKECQVGVFRKQQRETAVTSALALRQQNSVYGEALERVEVFKYLGRLLAQDDDDIQAIRAPGAAAESQRHLGSCRAGAPGGECPSLGCGEVL